MSIPEIRITEAARASALRLLHGGAASGKAFRILVDDYA